MIFQHFTRLEGYRRIAAASSPAKLLRTPFFWQAQLLPAILLLCGIAIIGSTAVVFLHSTATGGVTSVASLLFCFAVFTLFPLGVYSAMHSIVEIDVEHSISVEVDNNATALLGKIQTRQSPRPGIDQVESDVIPFNNTQPALSTIKLFQRVCDGARDRRIEPVYHLLQTPKEESERWFHALHTYSQIALRLGILGTFIGLMLALGGITGFMEDMDFSAADQTSIQAALQVNDPASEQQTGDLFKSLASSSKFAPMFDNLHLVFSTSIAGLETALLLSGFLFILRRKRQRYLQDLEAAASAMTRLVRQSLVDDNLSLEFDQIKEEMRAVIASVYDQTEANKKQMEKVAGAISAQTLQIENGMQQLRKADTDLRQFLASLNDAESDFLQQIGSVFDKTNDTFIQFMQDTKGLQDDLLAESTRVYEALSTEKLDHYFQQSLTAAGENISRSLRQQFAVLSEQLPEYIKTSKQAARSLDKATRQNTAFAESLNGLEQQIATQAGSFSSGMNGIKEQLQSQSSSFAQIRDHLVSTQEASLALADRVQQSLAGTTETFTGHLGHLSGKVADISATIKGFNPLLERLVPARSGSAFTGILFFIGIAGAMAAGLYMYNPEFRELLAGFIK